MRSHIGEAASIRLSAWSSERESLRKRFLRQVFLESARRYIAQEKVKARTLADQFDAGEGVLVWGAGDNFYRSSENSGPLSALRNMVILDRRPQRILLGNRHYQTLDPREGIQRYPWPIVVTVSEGRKAIGEQIQKIYL